MSVGILVDARLRRVLLDLLFLLFGWKDKVLRYKSNHLRVLFWLILRLFHSIIVLLLILNLNDVYSILRSAWAGIRRSLLRIVCNVGITVPRVLMSLCSLLLDVSGARQAIVKLSLCLRRASSVKTVFALLPRTDGVLVPQFVYFSLKLHLVSLLSRQDLVLFRFQVGCLSSTIN